MRLPAMLVTFAVLAGAASPALASTGTFEVGRLPGSTLPAATIPALYGPLPAGDGVVYAVGRADGAATVRLVAPGAGTRDIASFAAREGASLGLHASATRLVAIRNASVCNSCKYQDYRTTLDALLAGPIGGPLAAIAQCEEGQACAPSFFCLGGRTRFGAALGGDLLAVRDECSQTVSVTNLADGSTLQLGVGQAIAVAGPYVALIEPRTTTTPAAIVVRDGVSGAELYRTAIPPTLAFPITSFALLPDGTVVYGVPQTTGMTIMVATPAEPAGRLLRTVPFGWGLIGAGPAGVLLRSAASRLELVPLDGSAGGGFYVPDLAGAAFDGRTITWAQRACVTTAITSWTLGDAAPAAPDLRCPTALPSRGAVTLPRDRLLRVGLACPASARGGCLSSVRLTAMRRGRLPRGASGAERSYRIGHVFAALDPGERARVELGVAAGAARWVRRHAPLRLRIEVRSERVSAQRLPRESGVVTRIVALRAAR